MLDAQCQAVFSQLSTPFDHESEHDIWLGVDQITRTRVHCEFMLAFRIDSQDCHSEDYFLRDLHVSVQADTFDGCARVKIEDPFIPALLPSDANFCLEPIYLTAKMKISMPKEIDIGNLIISADTQHLRSEVVCLNLDTQEATIYI